MYPENHVSSSNGSHSPYLEWLRNCPEEDDESDYGPTGGLLEGLKSWLGFAGAMLGSDSGLVRRSMRKKSLLGKSSG